MTIQRPPIGSADTAPTAAQKVVAAMWTLGNPATAKAIAHAAGVGYSTVTPILRTLLADHQAVKTDSATGPAEWQLTATLPTPTPAPTSADDAPQTQKPAATDADPAPPATASSADADQPDNPRPDDTPDTGDASGPVTDAEPARDTRSSTDDDSAADGDAVPDAPAADGTGPEAAADTEQRQTGRTYRKPVQPRRPKGALRAAVRAVLTQAPGQAFKVSEICKAIDAANADGTSNKAGAGAVANALDKLVTSGHATRIEEAKYATYQATPGQATPADPVTSAGG